MARPDNEVRKVIEQALQKALDTKESNGVAEIEARAKESERLEDIPYVKVLDTLRSFVSSWHRTTEVTEYKDEGVIHHPSRMAKRPGTNQPYTLDGYIFVINPADPTKKFFKNPEDNQYQASAKVFLGNLNKGEYDLEGNIVAPSKEYVLIVQTAHNFTSAEQRFTRRNPSHTKSNSDELVVMAYTFNPTLLLQDHYFIAPLDRKSKMNVEKRRNEMIAQALQKPAFNRFFQK